MKVKLVSLTKGNVDNKELTAEELIVYTARVSNPSNQLNFGSSDKLLAYLVKNKHWSPFEMADMTVEIKTSRGIAQQILRHRSFSFQEFSQRYAKVNEMEPLELRYQAEKNRQSSADTLTGEDAEYFNERVEQLLNSSQALYEEMLDRNIAKECARFILPLTTQTTIYMKGSIRSWIHYLQIRTDEHTQLEHRLIGLEIMKIFKENFPAIAKGLGFE
jgi:thymidylate synthase (FAD)